MEKKTFCRMKWKNSLKPVGLTKNLLKKNDQGFIFLRNIYFFRNL